MMKYIQKQGKESGKAQVALLVVVALAAGAAGVWSELKAATVSGNAGSQMPPSNTGGYEIDAGASSETTNIDGSVNFTGMSGSISENGDGTATVNAGKAEQLIFQVPGCCTVTENLNVLWAFDPANTSYSQTVNIKPGMSANQTGSGNGNATLLGEIIDYVAGTTTPVTVSVQVGVDNTANQVSAFDNHTLNVTSDPVTGKVTASRVVSSGTAAFGPTAGSISISVNGEVYGSGTGGFGQVSVFKNHSVTRIQ